MTDFTPHQQKIIGRYYDNRDQIMLDKLSAAVTDLFLADTEAKRAALWKRADKAMKQMKVPATIIAHILQSRDPEILAKNLRGWLEAAKKRR